MDNVSTKRLWAPWRHAYISAKKQKKCILCIEEKSSIFSTQHSTVRLNIFPYNNGHLLVSPKRHVRDISDLKDEELLDIMQAVNLSKKLLDSVIKPQGYNIGINISRAAGAGITGHVHIHIVPRWEGDTNFMPVVTGTKVISQSLDELGRLLRKAYAAERTKPNRTTEKT